MELGLIQSSDDLPSFAQSLYVYPFIYLFIGAS